MTEPFSLVPLAVAAGDGRINDEPAGRLVAAGLTLLQRSAPLVRALAGRRAAVLLPTGHAFLTALAAAEGRGAVLVNPLAAPPEIRHQLADAGVGAVLTTSAFAARLPAEVAQVHLDDAPRRATVHADGRSREVDLGSHAGLRLEGEADTAGREEEAAVVYTSAMAGTPLGAVLTHRNLLANARATIEAAAITRDDHVLAALPFSHLFGLVATGLAPLLAGARVTAPERFHPLRAIETMERDGITALVGVPAIYAALVAALERRGEPLRSTTLRLCICGGSPLPVALQDRWAELTGVELRQGYGLTEGGPVCLFNRVDRPNRRGALGVPFPGVDVSVRDPEHGTPCADGETGELCVRGDNVSPGYVHGGALGLRRRDGWLYTGDLGARMGDGSFVFRGLRKAMFTRNGFNIYPRELERAVCELPGVREARVTAVGAPEAECAIRLEVWGDVDGDAVRQWCAARLSAYKQPGEVVVAPAPGV
ncbi:MAG TPA: AMP-binding protein [Gemmatimonadaceae bacterium]|nr:AMP-binding protein [Gemmatimonadaceae bacterium]